MYTPRDMRRVHDTAPVRCDLMHLRLVLRVVVAPVVHVRL